MLLVGDLHLTDRPKDAYRFGIFKWVREQQAKLQPAMTFFMGDLCHQKDRHSGRLVNRIVDELLGLQPPIFIVCGNHDVVDPKNPFFKFLNRLPGITFIYEATELHPRIGVIPHKREEADFVAAYRSFGQVDYVLCHNTFEGAEAETGARLHGFSIASIEDELPPLYGVYAGDVHKPQACGPVTYVGAPYTIRFGDDFEPRCLYLDRGKETNLYFECPRKWVLTVEGPDDIERDVRLMRGDQVKVTIVLPRENVPDWQRHKAQVLGACAKLGLEVFGAELRVKNSRMLPFKKARARTNAEILKAFCTAEKVPTRTKEAALAMVG